MPVSATDSETAILEGLWLGALGLVIFSVSVLLVLVVRRLWRGRRDAQSQARAEFLTRCFHAVINAPIEPSAEAFPPLTACDVPVLRRLALNLLRNVRGSDAERIVSMLTLWGIVPHLQKAVQEGDMGERIEALALISYFRDDDSFALLLSQIEASDMHTRIVALRGLAARGALSHLDKIVEVLGRMGGRHSTLMLADVLQRFGAPAVPALLPLLGEGAPHEVRLAVLRALGTLGDSHAFDAVAALLDDLHSDVRAAAIATLGIFGDSRAVELILPHLTAPEMSVRVQAAKALGNFQLTTALPHLVVQLDDPEWWVRFRAAEAIYRYGTQGIAILTAIAAQPGNSGRIAQELLAERGGVAA